MTFPAGHTTPHLVNLAVHVVFGSAALLLGIAAIITAKGGPTHRRVGRWFLYSISVVLATALIGLLVFDFRAFLFVVTLLSFYDAFSGFTMPEGVANFPLPYSLPAGLPLRRHRHP